VVKRHVHFGWTLRSTPFALAALAALAVQFTANDAVGAEKTFKVGDRFPDFKQFEIEGDLPRKLKGKVVVVDFWASWCGPCRKTFPIMEELHHRFAKKGLVILAVNEDKSRVAMTEFLKENPVTFSVVRDKKKKLAATINVPVLPSSYILDGEGRIREILSGERIMRRRKSFVKKVAALVEENSRKTGKDKPKK
jgi:thiol-disulfide isomerase/thioredoxin